MGDLFMAAIAVLAFVVLVALLWSNQKREKENYLTEGMCLGIVLGAGLRGLLNMDLGVGHFYRNAAGRPDRPTGAQKEGNKPGRPGTNYSPGWGRSFS